MNIKQSLTIGCFSLGLVALGACGDDTSGTGTATTETSSTTMPTTTAPTTTTTMGGTESTTTMGATGSTGGGPPPPPALGTQVDRVGRAAISTAAVDRFGVTQDAHEMTVDAYNVDGAVAGWGMYIPSAHMALAVYDALDNTEGNQALYDFQTGCAGNAMADCYATLATVLTNDWLVLNLPGTGPAGYLGVEVEVIAGAPILSKGGRVPSDDVIDTSYAVLSGVFGAGMVPDGVDAPPSAMATEFPYLIAPN